MKLRTALELGRVSNLPTTWSNVLAGLALAEAGASELSTAPLLMLAVSLHYVGGMYLNDAFDRDIDARERPTRPIPSGRVRASTVYALGFGMLGAGLCVLGTLGLHSADVGVRPVLAGLALCACIVLYDARHKGNLLAPVIMGGCRVLVYLVAALSVQPHVPTALGLGIAALWSYLIGLSYAARNESVNRIGAVWPLACLALPLAAPLAFPALWHEPVGLVALGLLAVSTAHSVALLLRPAVRNVPRAVGQLIAGIALLDAVAIAAQGHAPLALAAVAAWALTLGLQRFVPGT